MNPDGSLILAVGTSPHGQGHETVFAQIASDALGGLVSVDKITVMHGDTDAVQEGIGTMGSRAMAVAGPAVRVASVQLLDKLRAVAAHILEASLDDIEVRDGQLAVRGTPGASVALSEVALTAYKPHKLPPGMDVGLESRSTTSLQTCPTRAVPTVVSPRLTPRPARCTSCAMSR